MSSVMRSSHSIHKRGKAKRKSRNELVVGPLPATGNPHAYTNHSAVESPKDKGGRWKTNPTAGQMNRMDPIESTQGEEHESLEMQEFTEATGDPRLHNDIIVTYDIWRTVEEPTGEKK